MTPWIALAVTLSLLLLDAPLEPLQRSRAEAIQRSGELMLRLLNDLLDLARIEAGKLALLPAPFDLPALLGAIAAQQAALAERKGLRFDLVIDPTLPAFAANHCSAPWT